VFFAPFIHHHLWGVVGLIGLATAAHQGWSATLFTLPSDMFPKSAVGSVTGLGGMIGAGGGALMHLVVGHQAESHNYIPLFAYACSGYLLALLIIHLLIPKLTPVKIE
jgi:ACS family hexuronate transporter-like MFS transporter